MTLIVFLASLVGSMAIGLPICFHYCSAVSA